MTCTLQHFFDYAPMALTAAFKRDLCLDALFL